MMYRLMKERGANQLDALTLGLVNAMKYSNSNVVYPDGEAKAGDGVDWMWFLPVYKGTCDFSELNAIIQYVSQESLYDELGEMLMGIAMVEMKHLDNLGDLICDLGGRIDTQKYTTTFVNYGKSPSTALQANIQSEKDTISAYNEIVDKITPLKQNKTTKYCLQMLAKLIADEEVHVNLLTERLKSLN
jgi:bacterioferritin (cytochrome b1)